MNKDLNKLGFDLLKIKHHKPRNKKKSPEKSLVFSKKIVAMLEEKLKIHNNEDFKKVKLLDLKRAYKSGFNNSLNLNLETLAHVNMYLRVLRNESSNIFNNFKSNEFQIVGNKISVKGFLSPQEEDYKIAQEDIVKYKLEDFDFSSAEELYLEDEEDRATTFNFE